MPAWPRYGAVDLSCADGLRNVRATNEHADGLGIALFVQELDIIGARYLAHGIGIFERNAVLNALPRDGAVHRTGIKAIEPEVARDLFRH